MMYSASKDAIDLLHKIFQYNPKKRIPVDQICKHKYFHGVEELLQQDILKRYDATIRLFIFLFVGSYLL